MLGAQRFGAVFDKKGLGPDIWYIQLPIKQLKMKKIPNDNFK